MATKKQTKNYTSVIQTIKSAILKSRYRAAALANREMLSLYYGIGKYISENSRKGFWGTGAIETISGKLQQELPGLRGFSATNMRYMRLFYEEWEYIFINHQPVADDLQIDPLKSKRPPVADDLQNNIITSNRQLPTDEIQINLLTVNRQPVADDLTSEQTHQFFLIGFTQHSEILAKTSSIEERLFYIERSAIEFWSKETLRYHLKSNLYAKQGKLSNNFKTTISDKDLQQKALLAFKDEYLLDYINIEDPDDESDERVLESELVGNIRKFIMSLGKDFSFIGSQYRLVVEEQEFFIDLLFFNRQLQSLIAIELKSGDFKPEYMGKMNFYLSALDDLVRLPHENPSIGIILCKEKKRKIVEYTIRDTTKPMGVATYQTMSKMPPEYRNILPDVEKLKELL